MIMLVCVGTRLTSANQGLLVVGVILLSVAIVLGVIITVMVFKKGVYHSHRFSFVPVVFCCCCFVCLFFVFFCLFFVVFFLL